MSTLATTCNKASMFVIRICRICLNNAENGTNLFFNDQACKKILDTIYVCYQIILNYEEYLPSIICNKCIEELNSADKFRIKCITFEERFNTFKAIMACDKERSDNISDNTRPVDDFKEPEVDSTCDVVHETSGSKVFQCNICQKFLRTSVSLSKHIVSMHQKRKHVGSMTGHGASRKYHCTKCEYSTSYSQTLVNHVRKHNGERPYICTCGKSFTQAASLATHQKSHSNVMSHICSMCGKQFKHSFSLKKHLSVHKPGQFTCEICQKSLKSENSLTAHMNRHYNIRNYSCEECGNSFVTSTDLINHRKSHNSEKKAECHLCDYKTRAKKNLILHIKRHAGEKSFVCEICSKGVYTRSELRRHLRVHSREKPYPCPACAQRFSQPGSLNHHVRNLHAIANYQWGRAKSVKITSIKQEN